jgi:hypothetical protein
VLTVSVSLQSLCDEHTGLIFPNRAIAQSSGYISVNASDLATIPVLERYNATKAKGATAESDDESIFPNPFGIRLPGEWNGVQFGDFYMELVTP